MQSRCCNAVFCDFRLRPLALVTRPVELGRYLLSVELPTLVSQRTANYFSKLMPFVMAADRSVGRNVHLYDVEDRETVLGGLLLTNGVTKSNFYSMVEILLLFQSSFSIEHETSATLERNEEPLRPGNYYVVGEPLDLILMGSVG